MQVVNSGIFYGAAQLVADNIFHSKLNHRQEVRQKESRSSKFVTVAFLSPNINYEVDELHLLAVQPKFLHTGHVIYARRSTILYVQSLWIFNWVTLITGICKYASFEYETGPEFMELSVTRDVERMNVYDFCFLRGRLRQFSILWSGPHYHPKSCRIGNLLAGIVALAEPIHSLYCEWFVFNLLLPICMSNYGYCDNCALDSVYYATLEFGYTCFI